MELKFPISLLNHIIDYLEGYGLDPQELLRICQLSEADLTDPNHCLPLLHLELLIAHAYETTNDSLIHIKFLQYNYKFSNQDI